MIFRFLEFFLIFIVFDFGIKMELGVFIFEKVFRYDFC